jgi:hypothetical protein
MFSVHVMDVIGMGRIEEEERSGGELQYPRGYCSCESGRGPAARL